MIKSKSLFHNNVATSIVIRIAGLAVPTVFTMYGYFIYSGNITPTIFYSDQAYILLSLIWITMGVYQLTSPAANKKSFTLRILLYHLVASLFVVFVSGFSTYLSVLWLILFVATYIRIGFYGLAVSVFWFYVLAVADALLASSYSKNLEVSENMMIFFITLAVSSIAIVLIDSAKTSQKKYQKANKAQLIQKNQLLNAINSISDAILNLDNKGNVTMYNASTLSLLDSNDTIDGKNIDDVITLTDVLDNKIKISEYLKTVNGIIVRDDLKAKIDDEIVKLEVKISSIQGAYSLDDDYRGFVVLMRDITKEKSLEEERDEFISVVSHELRTPITVAEGTTSNLLAMLEKSDLPISILKPSIEMAHEQVTFLAKMVNDLSTLSRAERGVGQEKEVISVDEMLTTMHKQYQPEAKKHNLALDIDVPAKIGDVYASRLYLTELIQNFVTNSIKYTREGSVKIYAKTTKVDEQKMIEIGVKDTGIGISKHDIEKIFDKFYRSEDYRTRETGGTGLGLYVATKLSRKLDTKIDVKSRINHGSTFSIKIPLKEFKK